MVWTIYTFLSDLLTWTQRRVKLRTSAPNIIFPIKDIHFHEFSVLKPVVKEILNLSTTKRFKKAHTREALKNS